MRIYEISIVLLGKEYMSVSVNKNDDKEWMYHQRQVNHVYSERNGM